MHGHACVHPIQDILITGILAPPVDPAGIPIYQSPVVIILGLAHVGSAEYVIVVTKDGGYRSKVQACSHAAC